MKTRIQSSQRPRRGKDNGNKINRYKTFKRKRCTEKQAWEIKNQLNKKLFDI